MCGLSRWPNLQRQRYPKARFSLSLVDHDRRLFMITVGASAEVGFTVQISDTAHELSISAEDSFPEVLATSRMIAFMELAAARLMKPLLQPGQLSVGVALNVKHTAATPVGGNVRAVAT